MISTTADFFNTDDFAEYAIINNRKCLVMFESPRFSVNEGFAEVVSNTNQIICQLNDVKNVVIGDSVKVRNINYVVSDIDNDNTGIVTLSLHLAV